MKNLFKIVLMLSVVLSIFFFNGCDKNDDEPNSYYTEELNDSESHLLKITHGYTIDTAILVLEARSIEDIYGNIGNLYSNSNDSTEAVFDITQKSANCPDAQHTYSDETVSGRRIVKCENSALDCWVAPFNHNGITYNNAIWRCR